MSEKKLTTLLEIINYSAKLLAEKNIKDARLNIELMFCEILNCERIKLYLDFDKPLSQEEISKFKIMLRRRLNYEPLQYILGYTHFYGYKILLDRNVLIPRQETEILVEKVLEDIFSSGKENINILEIGTGSGCIAIALSGEMNKKNINHKINAIDISENAIKMATDNARYNSIMEDKTNFEVEDFLKTDCNLENYDYIISNPPYIPISNIEKLDNEVKNYEPVNALTDGKNGLLFYEKIINFYNNNLKTAKIFFEIGDGMRDEIENILKLNKIHNYIFFKDYLNIDRILKIN